MVVQLIDEVAIMDYFETFTDDIAGLVHVVNIDAAADPNKAISDYISSVKPTGLMLFVSIHEGLTDLSIGKSGYEFSIMLNVVKQVSDIKRATMLQMRKVTRECLLNVIGKILNDQEDTRENDDEVLWEVKRSDERIVPTNEMGNAKVYGHNTGIEIYVDMGEIMFKNI
jgi:hypothetical protein